MTANPTTLIKGLDYGPDLKATQSTTNAYVADLVATGANTTRTWGNWVNTYKNDPGVLIWDIGNEVILQAQNYFSGTTLENDRVCYAQFVNRISQGIHASGSKSPQPLLGDAWTGAWPYYAQYSPDLDMLAVNSYGGICTVQSAWASGPSNNGVSYRKPYIVTEFGSSGEWEVPNDSNGVPLEPTDLQKAPACPNAWVCITGSIESASFPGPVRGVWPTKP